MLKFVQFCKFLNFESKFLDLEYGKTASMSQFAKNLKSTHPSVQFGWIFAKLGRRNCSRTFEKKYFVLLSMSTPHCSKNNPSLRLKTEPVTAGADATKYCTVRVCLVYGVYSIAGHNTVQYEYVWFMVFTV